MSNLIILRNGLNCQLIKFPIFRNIVILSLLYFAPYFSYPAFGQELNCKLGNITWRCYDINLMKDIQDHGIKYESGRSIIWVEKDYLSSLDIRTLQNRIDRAIINIEGILGIPFDAEYYRSKKVTIYVHSKKIPSYTIGGLIPKKYWHPIVLLSYVKKNHAPYIHELVHIIAWNSYTLWLKEGLAVYLNDHLEGQPSFPNFGVNLNRLAKTAVNRSRNAISALNLVGRDGYFRFQNRQIRRLFYIFSGSFVEFLFNRIELSKFMKIYASREPVRYIRVHTSKKLSAWKSEWLAHLQSNWDAK